MKNLYLKHICILSLLLISYTVHAEIKLPALVSDGMVLQRNQPVTIWGYGEPGESVQITFLKKRYTAGTNQDGEWKIELPALKAGGPYTMTINDIILNDILIGDVWLCTGQSNSELPIRRVTDMFYNEVIEYSNPQIRLLRIPLTYNFHGPEKEINKDTKWYRLTPENAWEFSALCYFFAKDQYEKNGVPQGMISAGIGGTPAQAWISMEGLKEFPQYRNEALLYTDDSLIEEIRRTDHRRGAAWSRVLYQKDTGLHEPVKWFEPNYNDINWQETTLFSKEWRSDGTNPLNGSHWFRKEIDIPADFISDQMTIRLGCIVDADSVFINGQFIGTTSYQYPPRIYAIPATVLKEGKNQITIRVISYGGHPAFVEEKPYKIISGTKEINLEGNWKHRIGTIMPAQKGGTTFQYIPTGLYNSMIAPIRNYTLAGIIWYQGESNTSHSYEYEKLLTALITDWRDKWNNPALPFLIAQLPNFMRDPDYPIESGWANLRNAQLQVTRKIPNTALAVGIDAGEWNDIHPLDKKTLAGRLSLQAQRIIQNKNVVSEGPAYQAMTIDGNKITLSFRPETADFRPVDKLKGFAIAGADKKYRWAKATIEGDKIVVWNEEIPQPKYVRYAWGNNPNANLYNKQGLPASPFTTDN